MGNQKNFDREQNKDAQKSGEPVQLDKEQGGKQGQEKQGGQHQGGQHQGGQQMPGREQHQGNQPK